MRISVSSAQRPGPDSVFSFPLAKRFLSAGFSVCRRHMPMHQGPLGQGPLGQGPQSLAMLGQAEVRRSPEGPPPAGQLRCPLIGETSVVLGLWAPRSLGRRGEGVWEENEARPSDLVVPSFSFLGPGPMLRRIRALPPARMQGCNRRAAAHLSIGFTLGLLFQDILGDLWTFFEKGVFDVLQGPSCGAS